MEAGPEDGILCCSGATPFLFHRDEVLTTTGRAGIFRASDRGQHWQRSMDGLTGPSGVSPFSDYICQAPSQPRTVYALSGLSTLSPFAGVFASHDFGHRWERRGSADPGFGFNSCAVDADDPDTVYLYGQAGDFSNMTWVSTDGGRTVLPLATVPACALGGLVRSVPGTLYIANSDCLVASTDGGNSFHVLPTPPGFVAGFEASPDGSAIFLNTVDASFNITGTFRSTDGGASYGAVSGLPFGFGYLVFDPTHRSRIYASDGLLNVSTDGGQSFSVLPASNDPRFLGVFPVREIGIDRRGSVFVDTLSGPFRTDDGGATFRSVERGYRASSVQDMAFDANGRLLVAVLHTKMLFRQGSDRSFEPIGAAPLIDINGFDNDAAVVGASPVDPEVLLVGETFGQGLFRTEDGGLSWSRPTVEDDGLFYHRSHIAFASRSRVYLAIPSGPSPGLYRSDDEGKTFAHLSSLPLGTLAVDSTDPDILYGATLAGAGLFKSTDGGQTLLSLGQPGGFSALAVDRRDRQLVYAGSPSGQVIRSRDGGRTFEPASTGLAGTAVHGLAQDRAGTLFAWLRGGGLFASRDRASTWHAVNTGEALQRSGVEAGRGTLLADPRHPGRLYLGNAGVIRIEAERDDD